MASTQLLCASAQCEAEIPADLPFCPQCGEPTGRNASAASAPVADPADDQTLVGAMPPPQLVAVPPRRRGFGWFLGASFFALVLGFLVLMLFGVSRRSEPPGGWGPERPFDAATPVPLPASPVEVEILRPPSAERAPVPMEAVDAAAELANFVGAEPGEKLLSSLLNSMNAAAQVAGPTSRQGSWIVQALVQGLNGGADIGAALKNREGIAPNLMAVLGEPQPAPSSSGDDAVAADEQPQSGWLLKALISNLARRYPKTTEDLTTLASLEFSAAVAEQSLGPDNELVKSMRRNIEKKRQELIDRGVISK